MNPANRMYDETTRDFEKAYTSDANLVSSEKVKELRTSIGDKSRPTNERVFDYAMLFTYFRRNKDLTKCHALSEEFKEDFAATFSHNHLHAIILKFSRRRRDILKSIDFIRKSLEISPNHPGALHNLAESLYYSAVYEGTGVKPREKYLEEALESVDAAISNEPTYAKFHATRAKILAEKNMSKMAGDAISTAIELEDSTLSDYGVRIAEYLGVQSLIEIKKSALEVADEAAQSIRVSIDQAKRSNFEILSFFIAVVSFVIAGINIAVSFPAREAVGLIFVMSSALLMSVAGFSLVYLGSNSFLKFLQIGIIAIFMLGTGYFLRMYWV